MKKQLIFFAIICLLLPILLRGLWFYQGLYLHVSVAQPPDYSIYKIPQPTLSTPVTLEARSSDQVVRVLFDLGHTNRFSMPEIESLVNSLLMTGAEIETSTDDTQLIDSLRMANALVIIAPTTEFSDNEIQTITEFTRRGGHLLVVADPTRTYQDYYFDLEDSVMFANKILEPYGIAYQTDYVYNITHNEGNFRNIYVLPTGNNDLTRNIKQVVFYGSHSISGQIDNLLLADNTSLSSSTDKGGDLVVGALNKDGSVLVLGDMGFITSPYYQVEDNNQLVINVANFLAGVVRTRTLADFPDLFTRPVTLLQTKDFTLNNDFLAQLSDLQTTYQPLGIHVSIANQPQNGNDLIVLGLYPPLEDLSVYVNPFGLNFNPSSISENFPTTMTEKSNNPPSESTPVPYSLPSSSSGNEFSVPGFGQVPAKGYGFVLYSHNNERNTLVLLAETQDKLINLLKMINYGSLKGCMIQDRIAVCPGGSISPGLEKTPLTVTPTSYPTSNPQATPAG